MYYSLMHITTVFGSKVSIIIMKYNIIYITYIMKFVKEIIY